MPNSARIDELQKKFNENPRRYFAPLADEYRKSGDLIGAIELCRTHLAQQPGHMSGHIVLGKALYESAELDEARQTFETALGLDPENLIALRHLGDIAQQQGDPYGARQWYQRVLDADPRNDEIAAQIRALDEMPATQAFGAGSGAGGAAEAVLPLDLAEAPDTLGESTVVDGTLPPALEPSAIAYLAEEPTLEVPAYGTGTQEPMDLDAAMLDIGAPVEPPRAAPVAPRTAVRNDDIGLESMEFVAPSGSERTGRAEGLERPEYDFDPHVIDGEVRGDATPAAFVTETMAELYLQQGFRDEALQVYQQLLAANPGDDNLRARVQQLESGGRSSLAFEVSEDVVRAAQERHARAGRRTARRFFAGLAARRAPARQESAYDAAPADPYGHDDATRDARPHDAPSWGGDARPVNDPVADAGYYGTPAAGMEPQEGSGWTTPGYGTSAQSQGGTTDAGWETTADSEQGEGTPAWDATAFDTTAYDPSAHETTDAFGALPAETSAAADWEGVDDAPPAAAAPDAGSPYDVTAFESETWQATPQPPAPPASTPPRAATPPSGGAGTRGTVDALFGGSNASPADEAAAAALAGAFGGTPAALPAVRPATGELSLDHVFRDTPRRAEAQRRETGGFSFDQFFSETQGGAEPSTPTPPTPPQPGEGGDIEQFTAWLEGLKKK